MHSRLDHLRAGFNENAIDGFLISSSSNIFYLSGFNRFLVDHDGYLLVTKTTTYLITSPLYTEAVKKFTPDLAVLETSPDVWYSQTIKKVLVDEKIETIGFEEKDLRVAEYFDLQEEKIQLKSISLRNLRLQKDREEITATEKACELTDATFTHILSCIKEGVTELALAEEMQNYLKSKGADIGFPSIVAFGSHAAVPHHMTSDAKLEKNMFVLFDFGVKCDSYLSDMSRTVFFGKPTNEQVRLYETVRKSQQAAIDYIERGIHADLFVKDIDTVSRDVIEKAQFPIYPHALGHGIGLEVHEAPTLSKYSPEKLLEHVIFTIEPGIYDVTLGGVRIEDMFVIENGVLKELTHSSKDLIVI